MAQMLGQAQGQGAVNTNQALSAYTNSASQTRNAGIQFQSQQNNIPIVGGHYYAISAWFAEQNCGAPQARETFNLLDSTGAVITALGTNLNPCTAAGERPTARHRVCPAHRPESFISSPPPTGPRAECRPWDSN